MNTSGEVVLTAVALDGRVELDRLTPPSSWSATHRVNYGVCFALPDGSHLHLFTLGAAVREGGEGLDETTRALIGAVSGRALLLDTVESHRVVIDPDEASPRSEWDRIVIPARTPGRLHAIALLVGQSAALERYEHTADRMLEEAHAIASRLAESGRPPRDSGELVRRVGRLIRDRLEVARWFFLVDRPDVTWEQAEVAAVYDALFHNLELASRYQAVQQKLDAVQDGMQTTVGLWQERRAHVLEWAIVLLIVVEIVFMLLGLA